MKVLTFASLILVLTLGQVAAQAVDSGNEILEACELVGHKQQTRLESAKSSYCLGFIRAILFTGSLYSAENRFCAPQGASVGQGISVLLKYLRANPEFLHMRAESLTISAFWTAWPCK